MDTDVDTILSTLVGHAVWSVRHTHGSCFFMEFGNPHKIIREPLPVTGIMSKDRELMSKRRKISFRGDWSLLIYVCNWSLQAWDLAANHDSTPVEMEKPFLALDGQNLKSIRYDSMSKAVTLIFDLGAELRLWSNENSDADEDQWSLSSIDNIYRTFLRSGEIVIKSGDEV